jgi:hypothetical protein
MLGRDTVRWLLAIFLLLAVLAVCISPAVDLPATTLQSKQMAVQMVMAIAAFIAALSSIVQPTAMLARVPNPSRDAAPASSQIDIALPLLC